MHIGINGLLLSTESSYRQSGIDRYLRGLLSALPDALGEDQLTVYAEAGAIDPQGHFAMHSAPGFSFGSYEVSTLFKNRSQQEIYIKLWETIALRYKNEKLSV